MAAAAPPSTRWLHGPGPDLALGSGLLYVPILLILLLAGAQVQTVLPAGLLPLLILAFGTPHLGATLLRVYERSEDRRAYQLFAVHATLLIAAGFAAGLYVPLIGSLLITLYLTAVPWHFTGQNYGIALIFLRRRGIEVTPQLKRYVYASFVLPYALWALGLHGEQAGPVQYAPLALDGTIYSFLSLGIPAIVQGPALLIGAIAYVWVLGECVLRLRACGPLRTILPSAALLLTQGLWFAAPVMGRFFLAPEAMGPLAPHNAAYTFVWITVLHGVQYLWITTYYARRQQPETSTPRYLTKALLAGSAVYGFPLLILGPSVLGRLPYDAGLYLMIAGALNLHHVVLDGVIWKLRNARVAKILIRGAGEEPAAAASGPSWLKPLVFASGALGVAVTVFGTLESELGARRAMASGDLERLATSAQRLAWIGRDSPEVRSMLGYLMAERGETQAALAELEKSIALLPSADAWINVGVLRERATNLPAALRAYEAALELDANHPTALEYAGRALLELGETQRGRQLLERAARLGAQPVETRSVLESPVSSLPGPAGKTSGPGARAGDPHAG